MIKYKIYGYRNDSNCINWKVTTAIEVDQAFWYNQGISELIVVKGELTIGSALNFINSIKDSRSNRRIDYEYLTTKTDRDFDEYYLRYLELKKVLSNFLQGRVLLLDEIYSLLSVDKFKLNISEDDLLNYLQIGYLLDEIDISSGVTYPANNYLCNRCGSTENIFIRTCKRCNDTCAVCEECINLGRSKTCSPLYFFKSKSNFKATLTPQNAIPKNAQPDYFIDNPLTVYQQKIATESVEFLKQNHIKKYLIWAVTGAGKTEMIFPAIHYAISQGYKILYTAPRRDVVKELSPRFRRAFPTIKIVTLYGGSEERWDEGTIYIATTHQVLRFWGYFDLIIIDEFDAYPFNNQPILQFAVNRALKSAGRTIFMTATPSDKWMKLSKKELLTSILPLRHHQQPLPVPYFMQIPKSKSILASAKPLHIIDNFISEVKQLNGQAFIFVPKISDVTMWTNKLKAWFVQENIDGVYANDRLRDIKIEAFRNGEIRFLVTTTIMERGVTIPNLHVLVLNANEKVFDKSTLIQIAGRVGRSSKYPKGTVLFLGEYKTKPIVDAIKHIKWMNKVAKRF